MKQSGIIYRYPKSSHSGSRGKVALGLIALSLGGLIGPLSSAIRLESGFYVTQAKDAVETTINAPKPLPPSVPVVFNPLVTPDGASIEPINREFSLIVPKVGINAAVLPSVDPTNPKEYMDALKKGIAHASTSFFPDEDGTVYLFSHSTNYDWFVRDLNAVFYLLKNLSDGDLMVIFYKGKQYTYRLREKRITKPSEVSYLVPQSGKKGLILQTCWPPGSTSQRLLIFADLVDEQSQQI